MADLVQDGVACRFCGKYKGKDILTKEEQFTGACVHVRCRVYFRVVQFAGLLKDKFPLNSNGVPECKRCGHEVTIDDSNMDQVRFTHVHCIRSFRAAVVV